MARNERTEAGKTEDLSGIRILRHRGQPDVLRGLRGSDPGPRDTLPGVQRPDLRPDRGRKL